ncbi:DUF4332 domain-containing protein [Cyanobium sp. Alchichica 3B3-8F6]|uniref:DUF4332 domain-containing protein n=1 Tax=Cyanobium sp. Alchichica 3B3-8F6 TaxID=2823696 RepID=UPI0020CDA9A3|nr:DUF4332 domain-containing protein [Cyanobium sp. Alchichica 3B3-8F6]MCP9882549.1 DUF4332 domain-containing protein [Cyanobium sp. Alchichica 3B3-8F6]
MWQLPIHFQREQRQLEQAGIKNWQALAAVADGELRRLGRAGGASEARLIKLRGQARLVVEVGLEPAEAALLLYAGIASRAGLAAADPHQLLVQMGRLQRSLTGMAAPMLDLTTLRSWILRAQRRPTN